MIKILFVCHGNVCRSPMAEYVMKDLVEKQGIAGMFYIDSAATSTEEIGNGVHWGTRSKLKEMGVFAGNHKAVQMKKSDYVKFDYLIGMDTWNIRNMKRIAGGDPKKKIFKLLEFAGSSRDVADPWYTGDFDTTWDDVLMGCKGLLSHLLKERGLKEENGCRY